MAKSAGAVQDVATTAALTDPPPASQPTAVAQAEELAVEEPVEEETWVVQPAIQPRWQTWRLAEISLVLIALVFGVIATILRRSRRV